MSNRVRINEDRVEFDLRILAINRMCGLTKEPKRDDDTTTKMTAKTNRSAVAPDPLPAITRIALDHLHIETFEDRLASEERHDYRAVYVEHLGHALRAAHRAGFEASAGSAPGAALKAADSTPALAQIAMNHLHIETFEDKLWRQERHDYRAVHVTAIGHALRAAFQAGLEAASVD